MENKKEKLGSKWGGNDEYWETACADSTKKQGFKGTKE